MNVYPIQTKVKLNGGLDGVIGEIHINRNGVIYKIYWWDGRTKKEEYFYSWEFVPETHNTVKIGFSMEG